MNKEFFEGWEAWGKDNKLYPVTFRYFPADEFYEDELLGFYYDDPILHEVGRLFIRRKSK